MKMGIVWLGIYIATIFAANWALQRFGIVSIGFGYSAPAGVFFAGIAFTARDMVQDSLGRRATIGAILLGAFVSWFIAPAFAVASALAFLASEAADFAVYTPIRERHWLVAVAASNVVGFVFDSLLFLWLAFGSLQFWQGQLLGKLYMTVLAVVILWAWRQRNDLSFRLHTA